MTSEPEELCRAAVIALAHALDHRDFGAAAALFAEDGIWDRHGERLTGPAEILATISQRPETQLERHVCSTIHVTRASDEEWAAVTYVMVIRAATEPDTARPVPGTVVVGEFHDRFRLVDGAARFTYRTSTPVFRL